MSDCFERRRLRVYVAGPISKGDVLRNIHRGIEWGARLFKDGLAPYIPHLDGYMTFAAANEAAGSEWKALLEWDLEWVAQSEAIFRLAGESKGADRQVELALELGIPVFFERTGSLDVSDDYASLIRYARARGLDSRRTS